jgi:hypothetical protein
MENAEMVNGGNSTEALGRRHFEDQVEALQVTVDASMKTSLLISDPVMSLKECSP